MNAVEINNLTKKYGDFTAVNNISLWACEGEFVGFLGVNGAGKSTTIILMLAWFVYAFSFAMFFVSMKRDANQINTALKERSDTED